MREILFRAKDISGDWHYGTPFILDEKCAFICKPYTFNKAVEAETIGQYTGLTDKNGKKIFEGDVLSAYLDEGFPENETRMIVVWDFCGFKMQYAKNVFDEFDAEDCGTIWEVIGNIHDNPELWRGR